MTLFRRSFWYVAATAVAVLGTSSCGDLAPTAALTPSSRTLLAMDLGDGTYTMDFSSQTLQLPDGRYVDLTEEQVEVLGSEMEAIRDLDQLSAFTASEFTCNWHVEYCPGEELRASVSATADGRGRVFERSYGRIRVRMGRGARPSEALRSESPTLASVLEGWTCGEMRIAMAAARSEAGMKRPSFRSILATIVGSIAFAIEDGVLRGSIGPAGWVMAQIDVQALESQRVSLALLMLQALYNQAGCNQSSYSSTMFNDAPELYQKICDEEWTGVSLDGGLTWWWGWAQHCRWVRLH